MKCWSSILYHKYQSSLQNWALDTCGKFGLARGAAVPSWVWLHIETATTLLTYYQIDDADKFQVEFPQHSYPP